MGLPDELVLQHPALGDVPPVPHQAADIGLVHKVLADGLHRARRAVDGAQPQLDGVQPTRQPGQPLDRPRDIGSLLDLDQIEQRVADELGRRTSEHDLGRRADVDDRPGVVGEHGEVGGTLHQRAETALAGPQRFLRRLAPDDLTPQLLVGLFGPGPAAPGEDPEPRYAEPEHHRDQCRQPDLGTLLGLQRFEGGQVVLLLGRVAEVVDRMFGAGQQHQRVLAQGRVPSGAGGKAVPVDAAQIVADRSQLAGLGRVRDHRGDGDLEMPVDDAGLHDHLLRRGQRAQLTDLLLQQQGLPTALGQRHQPDLSRRDLFDHLPEQHAVHPDQADRAERDREDHRAQCLPAPYPVAVHLMSIESRLQIHSSGRDPAGLAPTNTIRVGPPSSTPIPAPSRVRVASMIPPARTSTRLRSIW